MPLTIELPAHKDQVAFNLRRWEELSHDASLATLEKRIETNRYGQIIMSPYAGGWHGRFGMKIGIRLNQLLAGEPISECPVSTSDGVRLADVGWFSDERFARIEEFVAYPEAPEICVEIISKSNTRAEIAEKRQLYFEAGCEEFWTCSRKGEMTFFDLPTGDPIPESHICQEFPNRIEL